MKNLFGLEIDQTSKYSLFHDESGCEKSNFLYHGFLFVMDKSKREILDKLKDIKRSHNKEKREIHFNELNQHSQSPNGAKTKVALDWLNSSRDFLEKDKVKFYCFGVNKDNVKNFWTNPNSYEKNVYLRFFEIGLKSAIRWFNLGKIMHTFLDSGKHDTGRQNRIQWLNFDFFNSNLSHEIDVGNIESLSSDENESKSEFSNFLQLIDVLLGVNRSSFIELSDNQKGQKECVEKFIEVIEMFTNTKTAYNPNKGYYKKFCISFFPTQNNLTKEQFLSNKIENLPKRGNFYCYRKTYRQQMAGKQQLEFNLCN